jgi:hypothetical protein
MRDLRLFVGIGATIMAGKAMAQTAPSRDVELIVYKDDFAMVSERRPVVIGQGRSKINLDDISKSLDPSSILFEWPGSRSHPRVLATTYELGAANGTSLMQRLNGHQVEIMWHGGDGKQVSLLEGKLETNGDNGFAIRTPDKLYVNPGGTIVASADSASTQPQLSVEINADSAGTSNLGMSYLTRGMSWSAEYVARLNPKAHTMELECWAMVTNSTGIPFPTARITLMAGSANRAVQMAGERHGTDSSGYAFANADVQVNGSPSLGTVALNAPRQTVGEMYAYDIPEKATIGIDQMNRVSVLGTRIVPIKLNYGIQFPALTSWGYNEDLNGISYSHHRMPAAYSMSFLNQAGSHLGIPLPSGNVRVYQKDDSGRERYTGAATIPDTPKREQVSLTLGNAFDVYGTYRVVKSEKVGKHKLRKTVEALVYNEKKTPVQVRIVQSFSDSWASVSESLKSEKLDSQTIEWKVPVNPGSEKKLTFVVDIRE